MGTRPSNTGSLSMAVHHRRAGGTKWLRNAEAGPLASNQWATKQRSLSYLRRLLIEIWAHESPAGKSLPKLEFGRGWHHLGFFVSYCDGHRYIELARGQRCALILIHEITHALGHRWHSAGFITRYLRLLKKYGRYEIGVLEELAKARRLTL